MSKMRIEAFTGDGRFHVRVEERAVSAMLTASKDAKNNETGGILIGFVDESGRAVIREATGRPSGSLFTWRTFFRSKGDLAKLLRSRWDQGLYYLGEWHSHPGAAPDPSYQDNATMKAIALDDGYGCKEPILIIVGYPCGKTKLSLTVFPEGEASVGVIQDIG
jgi:integrative and conjugative element protein (TIGR02256 family)